MSGPDRVERAAELLERLLSDASFRARFRAQPVAACREAGLPDLAQEIAEAGGSLQTLELRESRSSLVGVLMAAALEGIGVLELSRLAGGGLSGDAAAAAHRALTRSGMRAVDPPHAPHVPHVPHAPHTPHAPRAPAGPPPAPQTPPTAAGDAPGPAGSPAAGAAAAPGQGAVPAGPPDATAAGGQGSAPPAPDGTTRGAGDLGAGFQSADSQPWPDSTGATAPAAQDQGAGWPQPDASTPAGQDPAAGWPQPGASAPAAQDQAAGWPPPDASAPAAQDQGAGLPQPGASAPAAQPDAMQAASQAPGGADAVSFQQLADDTRITFPPNVHAESLAGSIDPRFAGVLHALAAEHRIGIGAAHGETLEITTVDGSPVGPGNPAARELMTEIASLEASQRPSEVAGPWRISAPGFTSDAGSQDRIHLAFGSPSPTEPTPPDPSGAGPRATIQFTSGAQEHPGAPDATAGGPRAAAASAQDPPAGPGSSAADPVAVAGGGFDPVAAARDYPGDGASKAALAHWMAEQARRAGLPPELPIMASLVESGLTNVNHGDRDSLGFFQMRTSIWMGQYPDYPHRPELQLKWFIDHALEVRRARIAAGRTGFEHDSSQYGDWIADIERPAQAYRGRYQLRLAEARSLLGQPATPSPAGLDAAAQPPQAPAAVPATPAAASSPRATLGFAAAPSAGHVRGGTSPRISRHSRRKSAPRASRDLRARCDPRPSPTAVPVGRRPSGRGGERRGGGAR